MKPYVVQQGDYLERLADRFGFDAAKVWSDPENDKLRDARRDPFQLHPGDVLHIPEDPPAWLRLQLGTKNHYEGHVRRAPLHLDFDVGGRPAADEECIVSGMGAPQTLRTDGGGGLSLDVPVAVRELSIFFPARNVVHEVKLGNMDPIDEESGVAKRLLHLGLLAEHAQREPEALREAILRFQKREGLKQTGVLDAETRDALLRAHGS